MFWGFTIHSDHVIHVVLVLIVASLRVKPRHREGLRAPNRDEQENEERFLGEKIRKFDFHAPRIEALIQQKEKNRLQLSMR